MGRHTGTYPEEGEQVGSLFIQLCLYLACSWDMNGTGYGWLLASYTLRGRLYSHGWMHSPDTMGSFSTSQTKYDREIHESESQCSGLQGREVQNTAKRVCPVTKLNHGYTFTAMRSAMCYHYTNWALWYYVGTVNSATASGWANWVWVMLRARFMSQ